MPIDGFREYKRREYCNDIKCPVQVALNTVPEKSRAYETIRKTCVSNCQHTTYEFHHWLMEKDYLILKPNTSTETK